MADCHAKADVDVVCAFECVQSACTLHRYSMHRFPQGSHADGSSHVLKRVGR